MENCRESKESYVCEGAGRDNDFYGMGLLKYDKKGPLHIYDPETAMQKINAEVEPIFKEEWRLIPP
jgi:hypothetical protein